MVVFYMARRNSVLRKKTLEGKIEGYKEFLLASGKSNETIRQYISKINQFLRFVPKDTVTRNDVIKFLAYVRENKNPNTYHTTYYALRGFLQYCKKDNLMKDIPPPKKPRNLPKYLKIEEVKALLDHTGLPRDRALILMLFSTGLRVSEICSLKIKDVDFKRGIVRVFRHKTGVEDELPIADFALFALREMINGYDRKDPEDPLFQNKYGGPLSPRSVQRILQKAKERAGINKKVTPHVLRHTFATYALKKGFNLPEIQEILGHASITTTRIYSHVVKSELEKKYHKIFSVTKNNEEEQEEPKNDIRLKYCPRCGMKVLSSWRFCVNCGEDLSNL